MLNHSHDTAVASSPGTRRAPWYVWFEVGGEAEEAAETVVSDVRDMWHVRGPPNLDPLLVVVLLLVIVVVDTHGAGAAPSPSTPQHPHGGAHQPSPSSSPHRPEHHLTIILLQNLTILKNMLY